MVKIKLDLKKSIEENAAVYFEKAKKAKKKLEGAYTALEVAQKKRNKLLKADLMDDYDENALQKAKKKKAAKAKEQWYEKFRWFISSEGFLVIGGRDATTNEIIIKKYTEKKDIVFHTDMAGSPFFVIKVEGDKQPSDITLQEVTNATFTFSRALKLGLTTANVFWVKPDQVTKEANTGEYLPKGAFMIRGKTNYMYPSFDLAIGLTAEDKIMCGPKAAIKKNCVKVLVLERSENQKPSDTAKKVKSALKSSASLDVIIRALPAGAVQVQG